MEMGEKGTLDSGKDFSFEYCGGDFFHFPIMREVIVISTKIECGLLVIFTFLDVWHHFYTFSETGSYV